ncbi:anaerobic benzoate catabolism transcriptional regulator [compost metagenome]
MARISVASDSDGYLLRLGEAIRAHRKAIGLSQEALADAAMIDRAHMGKIERSESNVTILNFFRIASPLDIESSALLAKAGL